jgi:hypothetical protein
MQMVPVVSKTEKPLMPCHPARARELVRKGKALRRFKAGIFYIQLTEREEGALQKTALGVDPGSKKEGFCVKSEKHTYLNLQSSAVTWVKEKVKRRRELRRGRRFRKTPCRKNRIHRKGKKLVPSTKSRWLAKLRIIDILRKLYPLETIVVEDIKARTRKGKSKWNTSFSPLESGKEWFYEEIRKHFHLELKQGYETKELRERLKLKKSKEKLSNSWEAHCVDAWVLANWWVGGDESENRKVLLLSPIEFRRRELHRLKPEKGGERKRYGGTISLGFKKGSLVVHPKYRVCYIGGSLKDRLSVHCIATGKRLSQNVKPEDCQFLTYNSWRTRWA